MSFFAQEPYSLRDYRDQIFFLLYRSNGGFDWFMISEMTVAERLWYVRRLSDAIKEENDARKEATRDAKAKQRANNPKPGRWSGRRR